MDQNTDAPFDITRTHALLTEACHMAGLPHEGATLLRLGENAIYRLAATPVVVRISRSSDYWSDAEKEVVVSQWLAAHKFPGARIATDLPVLQPFEVHGHPVTVWQEIEGKPGGADEIGDLGRVLRRLHSTPPPAAELPQQDIFGRVARRIETAPLADADRAFLQARYEQLRPAVARLEFPLTPTVTHGDAHTSNLMVTAEEVVLIDFERMSWGQPEWDISLTAVEARTGGWWSPEQYRTFADAYGYDITTWDGFDVLQGVHELKMTSWLAQMVSDSDEIAAEVATRMHTLRTGEAPQGWQPF